MKTECFVKFDESQIRELQRLAKLARDDSRTSVWEASLIPKVLVECIRIFNEGGGVFDPALSYVILDGLPDLNSKNKTPFLGYLNQMNEEGFLKFVLYDYQTKMIKDI